MKKLLLFVLFATFTTFAFAQDVRFGLQASPTLSWLKTDTENTINGNGSNLGLRLGILTEYYLRDNLAFTAGLGFMFNAGGQLRYELGGDYLPGIDVTGTTIPANPTGKLQVYGPGTNIRYKLRYIEVPVGFKMRTGEFGDFKGYLEAPIITFGFRGRSFGDVSGGLNEKALDIRQNVGGLNMSWGFGAGVEYAISDQNSLVAGIFYSQGFTDVTKDQGYLITGTNDQGTPTDPTDDTYNTVSNDSKTIVNGISLRLAFIF